MSSYRRRVAQLEAHAATYGIDRELAAMWPEIEEAAARLDVTPDVFAQEVKEQARERARIGEAAHNAKLADELGIPVEDLHDLDAMKDHIDRMERETAEWWAEIRAGQVYWRAGVKYVGGVPVDDGAPPWRGGAA